MLKVQPEVQYIHECTFWTKHKSHMVTSHSCGRLRLSDFPLGCSGLTHPQTNLHAYDVDSKNCYFSYPWSPGKVKFGNVWTLKFSLDLALILYRSRDNIRTSLIFIRAQWKWANRQFQHKKLHHTWYCACAMTIQHQGSFPLRPEVILTVETVLPGTQQSVSHSLHFCEHAALYNQCKGTSDTDT